MPTIKTKSGLQEYLLGEAVRVVTIADGTVFPIIGSYAKTAIQSAYNKLPPIDFKEHFAFSLDKKATTSAGVYIVGTNKLVRELWAAVDFDKGTHIDTWDGRDGLGKYIRDSAKYEVRILSHNINPIWKGVMANTSKYPTTDNRHKALDPIIGIRGFMHPETKKWCWLYNSGYGEGGASEGFFYADEPQVRFNPLVLPGTNQDTEFVAINSKNIFRAGKDPIDSGSESFVYATDLTGKIVTPFPKGVKAKMDWGTEYQNAIAYMKEAVFVDNTYQGGNTFTIDEPKNFRINNVVVIKEDVGYVRSIDVSRYITKVGGVVTIDNAIDDIPKGAIITTYYARITDISGFDATDKFLFIARKEWGNISVIDIDTGTLLHDIPVNNPGVLCVVGNDLWIGNGTNAIKRPINSDGSLGNPTLTIPDFNNVLDIAEFGPNITIIDGSTSQQIKTYNHTTGVHIWTRGKLGGLTGVGDKTVTTDTFLFNKQSGSWNTKNSEFSSIAFGPKGDYWLCDPGNRRVLHFDAKGIYIEQIALEARSYNVRVNPNDPSLIMAGFRVFKVDWNNPDVTKNWKLLWNFQEYGGDNYTDFNGFYTLSNGKMYSTRREFITGSGYVFRVVELDPKIGVRSTKSTIPFGMENLYEDGSIRWISEVENIGPRGKQEWWRRDLAGFDSDNDPYWSEKYKEAELLVPKEGPKAGLPFNNKHSKRTKNGNIALFEGGISNEDAPGQFRLGGLGKDGLDFQALPTVEANHRGAYPLDGKFDWAGYQRLLNNAPSAGYMSTDILTWEDIIALGFNGEFYKGGQLNMFNLFHESGLFLKAFGYERPGGDQRKVQPFAAGNALTPNLFSVNGKLYLVHGTEGEHQGIHVIEIEGWNSVRIQVGVPSAVAPLALPGIDLLADFKRGDIITGSVGRWTIPKPNEKKGFDVRIGAFSTSTYWRHGVDIHFDFAMQSGQRREVICGLGVNKNLPNWAIKGLIEFQGSDRNDPSGNAGFVIEVLDDAGLVISEFHFQRDYDGFGKTSFMGNGLVMATFNEEAIDPIEAQLATLKMTKTRDYQPFVIAVSDGKVVFEYADFGRLVAPIKDPKASAGNPHSLKIDFFNFIGNVYGRRVGFYQMFFHK